MVDVRSETDPKDMVLTQQRHPRDPNKFPTTQLFLLGKLVSRVRLAHVPSMWSINANGVQHS